MPFQQGQMLNDRYRIVKLLGQGGFGAVYRAWDTNLSRPCAVKENLDTSPEAHRQFSREATVLANLSHPNLPRVTDHFSLPGQGQYLVMDFVDGEDLATKLERSGPLPIEQALHWVMQVADALTYMHSRVPAVLHRDIKPANIRITPAGEATPFGKAMLVDFGLVKIAAPHLKTTVGARAVTPGYAPPEQYGQGSTDQRTDLYALGATLYSLLTNQRPMDGLQRMMGKKMQTVVELNPQIPEQLSKVIERVMSLDAKQRYQNADDFKAALSISIPTLPGSGVSLLGEDLYSSDATRVSSLPAAPPLPATQVFPAPEAYPVVQPPAGAGSEDRYRNVTPQQYAPGRSSDGLYRREPQPQRPVYPQRPPVASPDNIRPDNIRPDRAAARRSRSPLVWIALAVVALLCLGALAAVYYYLQTSDGGISEEDFQATVDERVLLTSTAQAEDTSAVETEVSGLVTPQTGSESAEEVRKKLIDAALADRSLVLGPSQGSLAHDPKTQLIAGQTLGVSVQYFILEVRFYNPYAASRSSWDYGLLFRHMGSNQHFRLIIRSDKTMVLMNNVGEPNGEILFQGNIPELNIDEGGWNLLTLYCLNTPEGYDRGLIYINKTFIAEIDLSMRSNSGDIAIVTGTYEGDQVEGESTDYQDLNLWSVP